MSAVSVHVMYVMAVLRTRLDARGDPEAGLTTVEWVILIGIVVAMAAAVGGIIATKVTDKAKNIPGL